MVSELLCLQHPCSLFNKPSTFYTPHKHNDRHGSAMTFKVWCSATTQNSQLTINRRSANFQPTTWNYDTLQSLTNAQLDEEYESRGKKLEEKVRGMLNNEKTELLSILELIDDIQRLGLGYRFKKDIKKALDRIDMSWDDNVKEENRLHATALRFRLFRQHGYNISQDVFKTFVDHKGNYMPCFKKDVKGLISLYEASYLAFEGEYLLEDAQKFAKTHLIELKTNTDPVTSELITQTLGLPLQRKIERLEARCYIESYSKRYDANYLLVELSQLDFNRVQSIYQKDAKDMTRWWEEVDLASKLTFARDRLMECYFWAVGMAPEPQFRNCRKVVTKMFAFVTTIDDIYDVYGTLDELELFTEAVERWDLNCVNELPDYMKLCFLALYNSVNEMGYETLKEYGVNSIPYLTKAWADLCKAFLQEAKWIYNKYTPTFEEYLDNAWRSSSGPLLLVHSYFSLNKSITKEGLDYVEKYHNLLRWPSIIFRLCNDLSTSKDELERGETASSILCYMKETGASEEIACEEIWKLIDKTWREMNKDATDKPPLPEAFVETAINLARISHCQYQHGDGHGAPDGTAKNRVLSIIINPISVLEPKVASQ
ncbi:isoprene synthase, chloroplastic-like [Mangifera indica]|uniref:isoprene synthase, chloroplastic-like n=1 Tax=Mangifera indica TaxID=29780 RepID=UPI001CFA58FB|nr:isoprene synthase, chloroplastic-like [Mangifera indica]